VEGGKTQAARFGIGEWYGRSFVRLTREERLELSQKALGPARDNPDCPFLGDGTRRCWKKGGICSLKLYKDDGNGNATAAEGADGSLRVMCPTRFGHSGTIFKIIGKTLLNTAQPRVVSQVRFLRRRKTLAVDADDGESALKQREDVGNIDHVLLHPEMARLEWCALEIQAVYFSGEEMRGLFEHIRDYDGPSIPFPDKGRRPDYRSSGPKRLMPQLQIKVPTLRRWGKKMAVVVDLPWFRTNVVDVATVDDVSNCDIAWFTVELDERTDPATLVVNKPALQTLERAVEGLTGGHPVALPEFESRIREKLSPKTNRRRPKVSPRQGRDQ
jgi:hypothetical protein